MVNPQLENGYFRISTEFFDALCHFRIPGEARKVFDAIIRKTWGWNKVEDTISLSQFEELTGLKRPNIIRAKNKLLAMNLIIQTDNVIKNDNAKEITYRINKDFHSWVAPLSKQIILSKAIRNVIQTDKTSLSKAIHTINTTTKDTTKDMRFTQFWAVYPKKKAKRDAEKAFRSLKPSEELFKTILADVAARKTGKSWTKENGAFVPYPATYLRGRRWEDEPDTEPQPHKEGGLPKNYKIIPYDELKAKGEIL